MSDDYIGLPLCLNIVGKLIAGYGDDWEGRDERSPILEYAKHVLLEEDVPSQLRTDFNSTTQLSTRVIKNGEHICKLRNRN